MRHFIGEHKAEAYKIIEIRIVGCPDGVKDVHIRQRSKDGRAYGLDAIQEALERIATKLEAQYPAWDFNLVELGPNRFNFVWRSSVDGRKAKT